MFYGLQQLAAGVCRRRDTTAEVRQLAPPYERRDHRRLLISAVAELLCISHRDTVAAYLWTTGRRAQLIVAKDHVQTEPEIRYGRYLVQSVSELYAAPDPAAFETRFRKLRSTVWRASTTRVVRLLSHTVHMLRHLWPTVHALEQHLVGEVLEEVRLLHQGEVRWGAVTAAQTLLDTPPFWEGVAAVLRLRPPLYFLLTASGERVTERPAPGMRHRAVHVSAPRLRLHLVRLARLPLALTGLRDRVLQYRRHGAHFLLDTAYVPVQPTRPRHVPCGALDEVLRAVWPDDAAARDLARTATPRYVARVKVATHAEMTLLHHLTQHMRLTEGDVGVSKLSCLACTTYLARVWPRFTVLGGMDTYVPWWRLPVNAHAHTDALDHLKRTMIEHVRDAMADRR